MCFLKHVEEPVHAVALLAPGESYADAVLPPSEARLRATIALSSFASRTNRMEIVGDILADDIIRSLSGAPFLQVISRLSTAEFRVIGSGWDDLCSRLNADYVIHGSYFVDRGQVRGMVELCDCRSGEVLLATGF